MRAGSIQIARFGGAMRVDKKGAIDLVTDVDVAVEKMFREMVAERFPDHQVLAEEFGGAAAVPRGPCWVFDPIDGTTNFAHGLPIFCSSLALEIDGVAEVAAVYDPNRRELFTAERGGGAFLNGRRYTCRTRRRSWTPCWSPASHTTCIRGSMKSSGSSLSLSDGRVPSGASDRPRSISVTWRRGAWTGSGKATSSRGTSRAAP